MSWTAVRFAAVGVCNTAIDWALFLLLHDRFGITLANFVSSSAGMVFSFVATTGTVMWVAQPLLIHGWVWVLEHVLDDADLRLAAAKLASIACSLVLNFSAYRWVVWRITHDEDRSLGE
jgi:putative flippase GtrA